MVAKADLLDFGDGGTSASAALTALTLALTALKALTLALSSVVEEADFGDGFAPSLSLPSLSLSLTLRSLPSLPMKKSLDHDLPFTTSPFGGEACDPTPFSMPVESTRRDGTARGDVVGEMEGMWGSTNTSAAGVLLAEVSSGRAGRERLEREAVVVEEVGTGMTAGAAGGTVGRVQRARVRRMQSRRRRR